MVMSYCSVLAAKSLGDEAYNNFLDHTFIADRKTTIRKYFEKMGTSIMDEEPPESLKTRYGGWSDLIIVDTLVIKALTYGVFNFWIWLSFCTIHVWSIDNCILFTDRIRYVSDIVMYVWIVYGGRTVPRPSMKRKLCIDSKIVNFPYWL